MSQNPRMTSYAPVFSATPGDLGEAMKRVRAAVCQLAEPRLYGAAFALAVNVTAGRLTWWRDWPYPVPQPVSPEPIRVLAETAMWEAFGFPAGAVLRAESQPLVALDNPDAVLVDLFFDAQRPNVLTVVRPGPPKSHNSVKVGFDHPAWIWNDPGAEPGLDTPVEYQTGNTFNQQNGIRCALPAVDAVATGNPAGTYGVERVACPHFGVGDLCGVNGDHCASDGAGNTRIPKPRVLVPADASGKLLLTPSTFSELVSRARVGRGGGIPHPLPKRQDLALVTAWSRGGSGEGLTFARLFQLISPLLVQELSEA